MKLEVKLFIDFLTSGEVYISRQDIVRNPMIMNYVTNHLSCMNLMLNQMTTREAQRIAANTLKKMLKSKDYHITYEYKCKIRTYLNKLNKSE